MKLTKQEVEHIATLARLELTEKEKEKFAEQLSSILDYFNELKKVDLSKVEPTAQVTGLENITRPDEVSKCDEGTIKKLISAAPERIDNLVKVKAVFE
ncbi:MAG: Asp-tRNA(Asn)/Glu-tRNA(Gln) amidotransferase subunit GatC [Patescibacteria group bacterium]